ncbi:MAG: DUF1295 domain-containing protein [Gammaproteobacteria bacterium]|nr:DUF1295 domain-containing protein [Gammaproteobacteria bacterium]
MLNVIGIMVLCSLVLLNVLIIITVFSKVSFWPPVQSKFKLLINWIPTVIFMGGIVVIGFLDWNSYKFDYLILKFLGSGLIVVGLYIALKGVFYFNVMKTLGISQEGLSIMGIYSLTRNPQYVGDIIWLSGYLLLTNSLFLCLLIPLAIGWFLLAPRAEEPLLLKLYQQDYVNYSQSTPRFLNYSCTVKYLRNSLNPKVPKNTEFDKPPRNI